MGLERINEIRKLKGLTNDELSKQSGVPLSTLSKITAGITKNPSIDTLKAIAKALNCSLEDFDVNRSKSSNVTPEEFEHIKKYRTLDEHGKEIVDIILDKESQRSEQRHIWIEKKAKASQYRSVELYDLPASAGTGEYLSGEYKTFVELPADKVPPDTDFAIKVSGDSMEPKFYSGDLIFVHKQEAVDFNEIGVFVVNGCGYVKKQGRGKLISLNRRYQDIVLSEGDSFYPMGKVIGKLEQMEPAGDKEAAVLRPVARNGSSKPISLDGKLDLSQVKGIEEEGDDF